MVKIVQYPHYLFVATVTESSRDEDGNIIDGPVSYKLHSRCREENNGGQLMHIAGGQFAKYASLIQCPKGTEKIPEGVVIIVANDAECKEIRLEKPVFKSDKAQLHTRIWV